MEILEQLFCGKLYPLDEKNVVTNSDYKKAMKEQCDLSEELGKTLSASQLRLFYRYSEEVGAVQYAVAKQHFMNGFVLGGKIMMEILKER